MTMFAYGWANQVTPPGDPSAALARITPLLAERGRCGLIRRIHGDLHLGNICLVDGRPTLFDCLEFSEALASIDVLYDLAFLLMDLEHRGLAHLANRVLNRYLDRADEDDGLAAMPLFLSLRAGIRGHVTATALEHATEAAARVAMAGEARRYLDLAHQSLGQHTAQAAGDSRHPFGASTPSSTRQR